VKTDDLLKGSPRLAPWRPPVGITPRLSDAELVTLAAMQALLGFVSEARWLRYAGSHLRHLFPYLPGQSGYNKRLCRAASLIRSCVRALAIDTTQWTDGVWVVDSTPVEYAGRGKPPSARNLAPDGPSTAIAPATAAFSGVCGCTWCAPWADCRSPSH